MSSQSLQALIARLLEQDREYPWLSHVAVCCNDQEWKDAAQRYLQAPKPLETRGLGIDYQVVDTPGWVLGSNALHGKNVLIDVDLFYLDGCLHCGMYFGNDGTLAYKDWNLRIAAVNTARQLGREALSYFEQSRGESI